MASPGGRDRPRPRARWRRSSDAAADVNEDPVFFEAHGVGGQAGCGGVDPTPIADVELPLVSGADEDVRFEPALRQRVGEMRAAVAEGDADPVDITQHD